MCTTVKRDSKRERQASAPRWSGTRTHVHIPWSKHGSRREGKGQCRKALLSPSGSNNLTQVQPKDFALPSAATPSREVPETPISGGLSDGVPPVPIPNTVVKAVCADDTWGATSWENRSPPEYLDELRAFSLIAERPQLSFGLPAAPLSGPSLPFTVAYHGLHRRRGPMSRPSFRRVSGSSSRKRDARRVRSISFVTSRGLVGSPSLCISPASSKRCRAAFRTSGLGSLHNASIRCRCCSNGPQPERHGQSDRTAFARTFSSSDRISSKTRSTSSTSQAFSLFNAALLMQSFSPTLVFFIHSRRVSAKSYAEIRSAYGLSPRISP